MAIECILMQHVEHWPMMLPLPRDNRHDQSSASYNCNCYPRRCERLTLLRQEELGYRNPEKNGQCAKCYREFCVESNCYNTSDQYKKPRICSIDDAHDKIEKKRPEERFECAG